MKKEIQWLTDTLAFSRTGGVNLSDIREMIMTRIEDLNIGYSIDKCPDCHSITQMTAHDCCQPCLDKRAAKFTAKFLKSTEDVG